MNMKKKMTKILLMALLAVVGGVMFSNYEKNEDISCLTSSNIEALAQGEVEVGPICMFTSSICAIFSDGLFIVGVRAY